MVKRTGSATGDPQKDLAQSRIVEFSDSGLRTIVGDGGRLLAVQAARLVPTDILGAGDWNVFMSSYTSVDHGLLARVSPLAIVAPLFAEDFDILDLITRVESLSYSGTIIGIAAALPNALAVQAEIRSNCSAVQFHLMLTLGAATYSGG